MPPPSLSSPTKRFWLKLLLLVCLFILLGCVGTVPFLWPSTSLWYKFGTDKMLLQLGKVAGLCAAMLLFIQIILALKLKVLDSIFGLDRVFIFHWFNSFFLVGLAGLHVCLTLIPEGIDNLPVGWKFWPEITGAAMLVLLLILVISAQFKNRLFAYHIWRRIHPLLGYFLVAGIVVHILYVSDSFTNTIPKFTLLLVICVVVTLVLWTKICSFRRWSHPWDIVESKPVNDQVFSLVVRPTHPFSYAPGQFAFLHFSEIGIFAEPHPFTIATAPGRDDTLQFYVKKSGDWTAAMSRLPLGSPCVHGPFGLFSYAFRKESKSLIFIAAGIGITPMLSMLQGLSLHPAPPKTRLIWSLRYRNEMFLEKELSEIAKTLTTFSPHIIYTREANGKRMDRELLRKLIGSATGDSHIYICGPEQMMKATRNILVSLGFKKKLIFWEKFTV